MKFGRGVVRLPDQAGGLVGGGGMGRSRSVRVEGEYGHAQEQGHGRSQSLLNSEGEEQDIQRQASGSGSQYSPQHTYSPSQYSAPHKPIPALAHAVNPNEPELEVTFLFYADEGGLRSTNESNELMDRIYYLGVIDILTPYGLVKRAESLWKGLKVGRGGRVSLWFAFLRIYRFWSNLFL